MSSHLFRIDEHVSPCQHIREYPRATAHTQEDTLVLAVKQYTPLDNLNPKPGDVTVIAAHANGFPKVSWTLGHRKPNGEKTNFQLGTLRTALGRTSSPVQNLWIPDQEYLDCRRCTARQKRHPQ